MSVYSFLCLFPFDWWQHLWLIVISSQVIEKWPILENLYIFSSKYQMRYFSLPALLRKWCAFTFTEGTTVHFMLCSLSKKKCDNSALNAYHSFCDKLYTVKYKSTKGMNANKQSCCQNQEKQFEHPVCSFAFILWFTVLYNLFWSNLLFNSM